MDIQRALTFALSSRAAVGIIAVALLLGRLDLPGFLSTGSQKSKVICK